MFARKGVKTLPCSFFFFSYVKSSHSELHQKVTEAILCSGKKIVKESVRESQFYIKEGDST